MDALKCGWYGTWQAFLETSKDNFISLLEQFYKGLPWTDKLSPSQKNAWHLEHDALTHTLKVVINRTRFDPNTCYIAFEHELTGEAGKRLADVNMIMPTGDLIVVEFKHKDKVNDAEIDRLNTDVDYISKFHSESIKIDTHALLAITKSSSHFTTVRKGFHLDIINNNVLSKLSDLIVHLLSTKSHDKYDSAKWIEGKFYRQPSILAGTVEAFFNKKMPHLKGDAQENIVEVRENLLKIYELAREKKQRYIVVVNGKPGAGKTLLGLSMTADLIYRYNAKNLKPVFLSGNVPLVNVLRYTINYYAKNSPTQQKNIEACSLIEHLKDYKHSMGSRQRMDTDLENFIIFDEAQRAWGPTENNSAQNQLEMFCDWLSDKEHGVLLLLVGDGQAIHKNEMHVQTMMQVLDEAIFKHKSKLKLIMSDRHEALIKKSNPIIRNYLFLDTPIRQIYTNDLDNWIEAVLSAKSTEAHSIARNMKGHYPLYLCRNRETAEQLAREYFEAFNDSKIPKTAFRMGWLSSSKGNTNYAIPEVTGNSYEMVGSWYVEQPTDSRSCCQLSSSCNEFGCQGLELNLALVNWGNDWRYHNGSFHDYANRAENFYTKNVYRVLLSRGRNSLIVMADDERTYNFLEKCGMKTID